MNYPSLVTIKKSALRAVEVSLVAGIVATMSVPLNITEWSDFKPYGMTILLAFCIGAISGIVKLIKGYIKYDLK